MIYNSIHFSSITKLNHIKFHVFFILLISTISPTFSDPRIKESGVVCEKSNALLPQNYVPTFTKAMETLTQILTQHNFATHNQLMISTTTNDTNNNETTTTTTIYSLAQCHNDLSPTDCSLCFTEARTKLPRCIPSPSGRIFLDGCFARYDRYNFYNESVSSRDDSYNCSSNDAKVDDDVSVGGDNNKRSSSFVTKVGYALGNVSSIALKNGGGGFGVVEIEGVYALAQCWESVVAVVGGCDECLKKAVTNVKRCGARKEGRGMNAGCYLRYSTDKFYNDGENKEDDKKNQGHRKYIGAVFLATLAFVVLSLSAIYILYKRYLKKKRDNNLGLISTSLHRSSLRFKYEALERATDYFSDSRKLGQGGSGSVYMGILPNRNLVAVKRLVFNTRQWAEDFFNEVNLISVIQHKNLVKLIGCSIEGPESLLVYEYVPNKSLDQFIFEKKVLNWEQRLNIIVGIAEGLAYLHGGTQTRIIHRDIKSSNVLLDENFTAKIADFGLVRGFAIDKSHLSTGIAGTLGYMAPEYLVRGQLTEKADVYSFGVLVLEVVSGRRNNVFRQDSGSLLQSVWRLYKSNNLPESVDPSLKHDFSPEEASNVLQIGLLCTQASVSIRPSMDDVVLMLTQKNYRIPQPNQPPFMNSSVLQGSSSTMSFNTTNSLVSNTGTGILVPNTSSGSFRTQSSDGEPRSEYFTRT